MTNDEILTRFAEMVGPETFNKFVRSLPRSIEKNRLEFWQEKLLAKARQQEIPVPVDFGPVIEFFVTAKTLPLPLSMEEFQADPLKYWGHPDYTVPGSWLDDCVKNPDVRENLSAELARSVSKVGGFQQAPEQLTLLSRNSTIEQTIDLYCYIRDMSQRVEEEWRSEFEAAFPA